MLLFIATMVVMLAGDSVFADSVLVTSPGAEKAAEKKVAEDVKQLNDKSDQAHSVADHPVGSDHGHTSHIGEKGVSENVIPSKPRMDMVIYSMAVFLVLLAILTNYAWGPIIKALDEREALITNNIESAEQKLASAEALLVEHRKKLDAVQDEVRAILAEARKDAEHTKNEIVATANKEAKLMQDRAVEEISRAKDQALNEVFGSVSTQVAKATEQVIRRSLTNEDHERFVNEAVNQFVSRN